MREIMRKMRPPLRPRSTYDTRVERLSRRLKLALYHVQNESEVPILLEDFSWSRHISDDMVTVVVLREKHHGQKEISVDFRRTRSILQVQFGV